MRLTSFWLAFICAASLGVAGQDDSSVQSKIIALEKAWNQAYKAGDRKALDGILDDQIVLVNDDGSVQNKAEFLKSVTKSDSQEQQVAHSDSQECPPSPPRSPSPYRFAPPWVSGKHGRGRIAG